MRLTLTDSVFLHSQYWNVENWEFQTRKNCKKFIMKSSFSIGSKIQIQELNKKILYVVNPKSSQKL